MKELMLIKNNYDLSHTIAESLLNKFEYPFEALPYIKEFILEISKTLDKEVYEEIKEGVFVAKSAKIYPNVYIEGPTIIGENTEIRPSAFIRGSALVGNNCVVGNSTELKNVILFDNVQVPHFNYVGDSVLGYKSHMGAGAVTSNVKQDKSFVTVICGEDKIETKLKKFGACLGDNVEIGCNCVLNPGTVVGKNSRVYPMSMVRGFIEPDSIYKKAGEIVKIK